MNTRREFESRWTRYRLIDQAGTPRRLMKVAGPAEGVSCFRLLATDGTLLDEEPVPRDGTGAWHFGFWVPEDYVGRPSYHLHLGAAAGGRDVELTPGQPGPADELPLRLDRIGEPLREHLDTRENLPNAGELADFVPDPARYLHQHRIIYQRPAEHWSEGLILGNGTLGAIVTGRQSAWQRFFLDRADLYGATPSGRPTGRFYAGRLDVRFSGAGRFSQELDLHAAQVVTRDGDLTTSARVNAGSDVLAVTLRWDGPRRAEVEVELSREAFPMIDDPDHAYGSGGAGAMAGGSWATVTSRQMRRAAAEAVAAAPRTTPVVEVSDGRASITHPFPNMCYAMCAAVVGASADWTDSSRGHTAAATSHVTLTPGREVTLLVAVTSDRTAADPAAEARRLIDQSAAAPTRQQDDHRAWWGRFWRRSFIELPDKLMENLWYFGAYHQACFSRSLQATSFLALWHPLDWRTWDEAFVADAQTSLMWWAPFAINHLELMLPSHNTWAEMMVEFLEHNPGEGALVTHMSFPPWAGGHVMFGRHSPHKGSVAWMGLNFWWDYRYSGDAEFLASVAYPVIAATADFHSADLVRGEDGRLHCIESGSPEQHDTATDNVYDRACIEAGLRAAISAAGILGVDADRAKRWQETLDDLYDFPCDETTLWETPELAHPYRCHPVVMFGVHPAGCIEPGGALWAKADATYDVVTNLIGHTYEDRHKTIPGHTGGCEPMGFATAFLMHSAARLRSWKEVRRLYYATAVRMQLKRNGLLSICDPRHGKDLMNMAISEATSGQTAGMSEVMVQGYGDHLRIFGGADADGVFRFAGLRGFGGFVLAGECVDGRVCQVTVHSLKGNLLLLLDPWPDREVAVSPETPVNRTKLADGSAAIEMQTTPGVTYRLSEARGSERGAPPPVVESRSAPREIRCLDWDEFDPPVVYYPEDPPFSQASRGDRVFLGMPAGEPSREPHTDWGLAWDLAASPDWRSRQTAARWLGRLRTAEATELLVGLAGSDPVPVVMYTAAVGLVRQRTAASLEAAMRLARQPPVPHVRREVLKAIRRLSLTDEGAEFLVECFSDLAMLESIVGKLE